MKGTEWGVNTSWGGEAYTHNGIIVPAGNKEREKRGFPPYETNARDLSPKSSSPFVSHSDPMPKHFKNAETRGHDTSGKKKVQFIRRAFLPLFFPSLSYSILSPPSLSRIYECRARKKGNHH